MTDKIKAMRQFFVADKKQREAWQSSDDIYVLAKQFAAEGVSDIDRANQRLRYVLEKEMPVLFEGERIAFTRTVREIPELFTAEELAALQKKHWIHEKGDVCNISVDYTKLLNCGFDAKRKELNTLRGGSEINHYLDIQLGLLDAVQALSDRYRELAVEQGNTIVAESLAQVPARAPRNFVEALQMFRILHFTMWCGRNYHNTIGRFDQYMYPYYKADMDAGLYTQDEVLELLEEFFLTFNRDSDLYPGMQQGDNGQSMVLGGWNTDGTDGYNELSELCLNASLELKLIDPKINLRVSKNTPIDRYVLGTHMTKQGTGFPQYSSDDVVISGLIDLGYAKEDAYQYVVAACWEFIIPGKAMDIPNIAALSFAKAVGDAVFEALPTCESYAAFDAAVGRNINMQVDSLCEMVKNLYLFPAPFVSLMMEGCSVQGRDISLGGKYNNYGFHGTGIATAADAMAAIKKYIFEERSIAKEELLDALNTNFVGHEQLCSKLRYESPKMGNNEDYVDDIASGLLERFADALKGRKNERGGVFRAGTGSAMYYIWHAKELPASADGRRAAEGLAANYSPSLFSRCKGPVSIIKSFTKPNLSQVINGGPLTLELHDTVFRTEDSIEKVAMLVKSFIDMDGHQLQLNAVNRDMMLDAQKHPEKYRNLIVRVWGWSGYFVELDKIYQDHIIQRMELAI